MFGALLGTLQSFQKTTKKDEDRVGFSSTWYIDWIFLSTSWKSQM